MNEPEVNLGMDWLAANNMKIDCQGSNVWGVVGTEEYGIDTKEWTRIDIMQAKKVWRNLEEGDEVNLVVVLNLRKELPKLKDVAMVREFEDMFPEELPGLPSFTKVDFVIEVVPRT